MPLKKNEIKNISFEEALSKLENIITDFENGKSELEQLIDQYDQATLLKQHCQQKLEKAKLKIENIMDKEGDKYSKSL